MSNGNFGYNDSNLDTKKIWDEFVEGDERYFKKLFKAFYEEMYGYGLKICGNSDLVKDSIQELFKTIWERRKDLHHVKTPNYYLYVSLRRKILKKKEKKKKRRGDSADVKKDHFKDFGIEELIIIDERKYEQKQRLRRALNQLSDREKEVVFLHYYNGMSYNEIGKILSVERRTVRQYIYRAMETLRTILDHEIMKLVISLLISLLINTVSFI